MSYDKPARYMKEYLASLMPLLRGETVQQRRRARHDQRLLAHRRPRRDRPAGPGRRAGRRHAQAGRHRRRRHHHLDDRDRARSRATSRPPSAPPPRRPAGPSRGSWWPCPSRSRATSTPPRSGSTRRSPSTRTCPRTRPCWTRRAPRARPTSASSGTRRRSRPSIGRLADAGATDFVAAIVGDAAERERELRAC